VFIRKKRHRVHRYANSSWRSECEEASLLEQNKTPLDAERTADENAGRDISWFDLIGLMRRPTP
jgi:hypothetical protein